jgi:hypothetical protein
MASKKNAARKKAIRKTIKRINASITPALPPEPKKSIPIVDLNQRLEPCAREGCDRSSQVGDRLCKRHRVAMEESRARNR